jgi:glycosyltransferase involved in cell wall biosynthesis
MKVLIAAAQHSSQMSGIQRHALMLTRALLQQTSISQIDLVVAPWQKDLFEPLENLSPTRVRVHVAGMSRGVIGRNIWYYSHLPTLLQNLRSDVLHLSYPVPVQRTRIAVPIALTLHDLYPYDIPENFGFPKVFFNRIILQQCLRSVDAIACVSDATLSRLQSLVHHSVAQRAIRIYNSAEPSRSWSDTSPVPDWRGEPFILTVSQHRRNKNVSLLIRVFNALLRGERLHPHTKLVVVGIEGPETPRLQKLVADLKLLRNVVFLQGVTDDELQWCYRHADLLVAPSRIEGFGLPVAEGLMAGCRVVCSDIPAFREIDSEHSTYFSLQGDCEKNLQDAMSSALDLPDITPIPMSQFSSARIGAEYVRFYRQLLEEGTCSMSSSPLMRSTSNLWNGDGEASTPRPATRGATK